MTETTHRYRQEATAMPTTRTFPSFTRSGATIWTTLASGRQSANPYRTVAEALAAAERLVAAGWTEVTR